MKIRADFSTMLSLITHGMPLVVNLGLGDSSLVDIGDYSPKVKSYWARSIEDEKNN